MRKHNISLSSSVLDFSGKRAHVAEEVARVTVSDISEVANVTAGSENMDEKYENNYQKALGLLEKVKLGQYPPSSSQLMQMPTMKQN